jgi:colanic acid biosynthesis glycosyl transferase WcaI
MSRPRVTLLTQIFPPESNAGANRAGAAAQALAAAADLRVVTILPSYPSPEHHLINNSLDGHDEAMPYVIERSVAFHPHRGSYVVRAAREVGMALRVAARSARPRPDVFVATSPSIFIGIAGAIVSGATRRPLVIDLRDLTWEYLADDSRNRTAVVRMLATLLKKVAVISLKRASLVSVSNPGIRKAIEHLGVAPDRIIDVPNGVSGEILERGAALSSRPAVPDRFVVTYAGALGHYQGIATLVDVAQRLPEVEFRLIGDGPQRESFLATVQERRLENVSLPGYLSRDAVFDHYEQSDIVFAQLRDLPVLASATFPSKPYELMATGRPIVYAGTGITAKFLEGSGSAIIAEAENVTSITKAITRLINDPDLRRTLGEAGRDAAPAYLREAIMDSFAAAVVTLVDG